MKTSSGSVNAYRPVLADNSSVYRFKPYVKDGVIMPNPGRNAFESVDSFLSTPNKAFDSDFWFKPRHQFPFSISYVQAMESNYFYFKRLSRKLRKLGVPEYFLAYRSERLSMDVLSLFERFTSFAEARDLTPIVLFIPRDKYDTKSVSKFLEKNEIFLPRGLLIGDVGGAEMDWDHYSLIETKDGKDVDFSATLPPTATEKLPNHVADLLPAAGGGLSPFNPKRTLSGGDFFCAAPHFLMGENRPLDTAQRYFALQEKPGLLTAGPKGCLHSHTNRLLISLNFC